MEPRKMALILRRQELKHLRGIITRVDEDVEKFLPEVYKLGWKGRLGYLTNAVTHRIEDLEKEEQSLPRIPIVKGSKFITRDKSNAHGPSIMTVVSVSDQGEDGDAELRLEPKDKKRRRNITAKVWWLRDYCLKVPEGDKRSVEEIRLGEKAREDKGDA